MPLQFNDKVVIITGAGGNPSLGRGYADYFGGRGVRIVVNDLGVGPDGRGVTRANAEAVVEEVRAAGGEAVADLHSVADPDSAEAIVQTAIDNYGRVDVLINNAGVAHMAMFDELSANDMHRMVNVHLEGTIWMCRAVWPHMTRQGYGRIVNTGSAAAWGLTYVSVYGAAKGGIYAFLETLPWRALPTTSRSTRSVRRPSGFRSPTRTTNPSGRDCSATTCRRNCAPAVGLLSHDECPCTGKFLQAGGGSVQEAFMGLTVGYSKPDLTDDDLKANWDQVTDRANATWFADLGDVNHGENAITPKKYVPAWTPSTAPGCATDAGSPWHVCLSARHATHSTIGAVDGLNGRHGSSGPPGR